MPRAIILCVNSPTSPQAEFWARKHVAFNGILMLIPAPFGVFCAFCTFFGVITAISEIGSPSTRIADWVAAFSLAALFLFASLPILCLVAWGVINTWWLWLMRPWALYSTVVFWILAMCTIIFFPIGLYGVISLTRPSVLRLFHKAEEVAT